MRRLLPNGTMGIRVRRSRSKDHVVRFRTRWGGGVRYESRRGLPLRPGSLGCKGTLSSPDRVHVNEAVIHSNDLVWLKIILCHARRAIRYRWYETSTYAAFLYCVEAVGSDCERLFLFRCAERHVGA